MAIPRLPDPSNPESIDAAEFDTRRRGFDPMQVRAYLKVLARELTRLRDRETELQSALADVRTQSQQVDFDEERATVLLGEETTRVLSAARGAAADKLARANEQAREIVEAAEAEAAAIRSGAHAAVDNELAAARAEGRAIIAEAKLVRERMLDDLATKRHAMRVQLEQLRAGRDRLLESYAHIRRSLDDVSGALDDALPNAQMAARRAAEREAARPVPSAASIEREIDDAARAGMPIVSSDEVEVEAEVGAAAEPEEEPAGWVNAGTPPAPSGQPPDELFGAWDDAETKFFLETTGDADAAGAAPPRAEGATAEPDASVVAGDAANGAPGHGDLSEADRAEVDRAEADRAEVDRAEADRSDDDRSEAELSDDEIERVVVLRDAPAPTGAPAAGGAAAPTVIDGSRTRPSEPGPEPEPHEILLAEVTRSRRDTGLPREAVPIVDPPDAVEVVRVFRDGALPEPAAPRAEPAPDDAPAAAGDAVAVEVVTVVEVAEVAEVALLAVVEDAEDAEDGGVPPDVRARSPRVAEFAPVSSASAPEPEPALEPAAVSEPEPEPEPEPEHAAEAEHVAEAEAELVVEPAPEPVAEPEPEPVAASETETEPEVASDESPPVAVDDVFARIRRTREEKVARAEEVLRSALFPSADAATAVAEPEPAPEPVAAAESLTISGDRLGAVQADDAERFAERDRVLAPLQAQIARKIKRLLADEQNDVLDLVRRSHGRVEHDDVLPAAADHAGGTWRPSGASSSRRSARAHRSSAVAPAQRGPTSTRSTRAWPTSS